MIKLNFLTLPNTSFLIKNLNNYLQKETSGNFQKYFIEINFHFLHLPYLTTNPPSNYTRWFMCIK